MNEAEQMEQPEQPEQPEEESLSPREKRLRSILEWTETIVMAIVLVSLFFTFVVRVITVDGGSMQPTYFDGDRVLVSSLGAEPEQGDVVIVVNVLEDPIIKRVIATEGQTVDFHPIQNEVVVDGSTVIGARFGIENGITSVPDLPDRVLQFPQTVPEGCVFVLGDNRQNSTDSRFSEVGMIDRRNILGKVVFDLYPFSKLGPVEKLGPLE